MILYEDGKKIGEISDWTRIERPSEKREVLGKLIETRKPKDQCQFVSPKPVRWKNKLWIITEDGTKLTLTEPKIVGGTKVTATIDSELRKTE